MNSHPSFFKGTLILAVANIISRFIGFYNRIFLSSLIGAHQLGVYQLIFPIYLVGFAFCFHGFETALSKIAAALIAKEKDAHARKLLYLTITITLFLSLAFTIIIEIFAKPICMIFFGENDCIPCLQLAFVALPFVGIKSCIHSYSIGLGKPNISAISLCFEQVIRVVSIYIISITFFLKLQVPALIAVLGMIIGEIASCIFTVAFFILTKKKTRNKIPFSKRAYTKELFQIGFPLTCNSLSVTLLHSAQNILIPLMLTRFYQNSHYSIELFGILTGMALPFIMFPSTITNSLSTMLLPKISATYEIGNKKRLRNIIVASVIFCIFLGICSFIFFFSFGPVIGTMIFHNRTCGEFLRNLAVLCPFIYLSGTLASILNGLGQTKTTLFHNMISHGIEIGFILFAVPFIGIYGHILGLLISSIFLVGLHFKKLRKWANAKNYGVSCPKSHGNFP